MSSVWITVSSMPSSFGMKSSSALPIGQIGMTSQAPYATYENMTIAPKARENDHAKLCRACHVYRSRRQERQRLSETCRSLQTNGEDIWSDCEGYILDARAV